jgi:integrase
MARKTNCVIGGKKRYRLRKKVNGEMMNFYGDYYEDAVRVYKDHLLGLESNAEFKRSEVFQDVFESWFEIVHKPKLAPSSYTTYESTYRVHVKPMKFTQMNLVDVRSIDIQQGLNKVKSAYRANRIYLLLSTFYKYCLSQPDRVIYHNPLDTVNVPKHHKNTQKKLYLMKADVARLIHFFESDFSLFIYVFAAFTGMRQGEILALT